MAGSGSGMLTRRGMILSGGVFLAGCSGWRGLPEVPARGVTGIQVEKSLRRMHLSVGKDVVRSYDISLGFAPQGHKRMRGDGRTPEGLYRIDRRNPGSRFHLSLGISYPSPRDLARAERHGLDPGGNIFVHGYPNGNPGPMPEDWTAGCIAVTNKEMEEIWELVPLGCPILIGA